MKTVVLADGQRVSALGQGTWGMGENKSDYADEAAALRLGIDLGLTLIDTAEMYGEGGAEEVVASAVEGERERAFIVTKAYPHNASRAELPRACERSLKRLRTEVIDLYLLHWRGNVPLAETVAAFEKLRAAGKIRRWGVSNFDVADMEDLFGVENGPVCTANQVLYNLEHREIESNLLPWSQNRRIPIMAYAPVGHSGRLLRNATLNKVAARHGVSSAQIALAWLLRQPRVIAIPKAANEKHVRENATSVEIELTQEDLADIDRAFPPPKSDRPLPML